MTKAAILRVIAGNRDFFPDTMTGRIIGQNQQRHRSQEFRNFLDTIEKNVPGGWTFI